MNPLIITATPNNCWLNPEFGYARTPEEFAKEAALCQENGASVLHMHGEVDWRRCIQEVRSSTDIVIQAGMSSLTIADRMAVYQEAADMISVMTGHHDEAFVQLDCHVLHPREELVQYCEMGQKYDVKPEWEIWHTGHLWNMHYLQERQLIKDPAVLTLFFGWPGGNWTPPTVAEYEGRRSHVPEEAVVTLSVMGQEQMTLLVHAIQGGDHVRVGTEDYPFDVAGQPVATHVLVRQIAEIASALGRPVATPSQAREILGLKGGR